VCVVCFVVCLGLKGGWQLVVRCSTTSTNCFALKKQQSTESRQPCRVSIFHGERFYRIMRV